MCDQPLTTQSRWALLLMAISVIAAGVTRSTASQQAARAEVVAAVAGRLEAAARNDRDAWSNYVMTQGADNGAEIPLTGPEAWLIEAGLPYASIEDVEVRLSAQTAVVSYRLSGTNAGARRVETLIRRDGRWLLVGIAREPQLEGSAAEQGLSERASVGRPTVLR